MYHNNIDGGRNNNTINLLSLIVGLGVTLILIFNLVLNWRLPNQVNLMKEDEIILGYQIWEIELRSKSVLINQKRDIATRSTFKKGLISKDQWGSSYQYQIIGTDFEPKIYIWSLGPNTINESENTIPTFMGDDIGQILSIKI